MKRLLSTISLAACVIFLSFADQLQALPPKEITNSIGMKLVLIPKGTFTMGSPESEEGRQDNETQHEVTISKDYYVGVCEVTQAQYEKVMGKNPSHFQGAIVGDQNSDLPVENVSWEDAVEFCKRLSVLSSDESVATLIDELKQRANDPQVPESVLERAVGIASIISKNQSNENQTNSFAFEAQLLKSILLDPKSVEAWALLSSSNQLPIARFAAKSWEELSQDNSMPCYVNAVLALKETPPELEEFWGSVKLGNLRSECIHVDIPWPTEFILRTPKDLKDREHSDIPVTPSMFRFMVNDNFILNPATAPTLANPQSMIALSSIGYQIEESSELQELLAGAKFTTHLCHSNRWQYGLEAYGRFGRKIFIKLEQLSQQVEPAGSLEQIKQDRERCWRVAEELRSMGKDFSEHFRHSPPINEQLLDLEAKRIMNIIMKVSH